MGMLPENNMKVTDAFSSLEEITMDRLVKRGFETNNHQAYIRYLVNSYNSCTNPTIQQLNGI